MSIVKKRNEDRKDKQTGRSSGQVPANPDTFPWELYTDFGVENADKDSSDLYTTNTNYDSSDYYSADENENFVLGVDDIVSNVHDSETPPDHKNSARDSSMKAAVLKTSAARKDSKTSQKKDTDTTVKNSAVSTPGVNHKNSDDNFKRQIAEKDNSPNQKKHHKIGITRQVFR